MSRRRVLGQPAIPGLQRTETVYCAVPPLRPITLGVTAGLHVLAKTHHEQLRGQLKHLREADSEIEALILLRTSRLDYFWDKPQRLVDPDAEAWFKGEYTKVSEILAPTLRGALFTASFGVFEHYLTELCSSCRGLRGELVTVQSTRDGVESAKAYFERLLEAQLTRNSRQLWTLITQYRLLRNVVVHAQGRLEKFRMAAEISELQRRVRTFSIDPIQGIALGSRFNVGFIVTVARFAFVLTRTIKRLPQ